MDLDHCICSGKSLAKLLRPGILAVLARKATHGYLVARQLRELSMFAEGEPDHAGLYRTLKAMEEEGLVAANWDLADRGPARRRYRLTAAGRKCLARWLETLEGYRQAIDELLSFSRAQLEGDSA